MLVYDRAHRVHRPAASNPSRTGHGASADHCQITCDGGRSAILASVEVLSSSSTIGAFHAVA